jgi:hypothetical protein
VLINNAGALVSRVSPLDVVHRDPQVAFKLATVMYADDMRVPQRRGQLSLAVEPLTEVRVRCYRFGHDSQSVAPCQPRVLSKIDLGHPAGTQQSEDGVTRESCPHRYRHAADSTAAVSDRRPESVAQSAVSLDVMRQEYFVLMPYIDVVDHLLKISSIRNMFNVVLRPGSSGGGNFLRIQADWFDAKTDGFKECVRLLLFRR